MKVSSGAKLSPLMPKNGTYLYAFPIQQTLMHYHAFSTMQLMILSIPLTYIVGLASWHLVEKRTQRFQLKQAKN